MQWTIEKVLEERGVTGAAIANRSGLSRSVVYPITRGKTDGVTLKTLERIALAIEELSGEPIRFADLVELRAG